jgi:hypothetical protein
VPVALANNNAGATQALVGLPIPGTAAGNSASSALGRNFAVIGATARYQPQAGLAVIGDYRLTISSRSQVHSGLLGMRIAW